MKKHIYCILFLFAGFPCNRIEKIDGLWCGHINCQEPPSETEPPPGPGGLESCHKHAAKKGGHRRRETMQNGDGANTNNGGETLTATNWNWKTIRPLSDDTSFIFKSMHLAAIARPSFLRNNLAYEKVFQFHWLGKEMRPEWQLPVKLLIESQKIKDIRSPTIKSIFMANNA